MAINTLSAGEIFVDFLRVQYGIGTAVTVLSNIVLWLCFVWCDSNTLVDFGWAWNQFLLAALCFALRETDAAYAYLGTNRSVAGLASNSDAVGRTPVRNIIALIIIFLWAARLGGFIFVTRVMAGENDRRYEAMASQAMLPGSSSGNNSGADTKLIVADAANSSNGAAVAATGAAATATAAPAAQPLDRSTRIKYFFFQFFLQAVMVVFPASPVYFIFGFSRQTAIADQWSFWVGIAIAVLGTCGSTLADVQLERYKHEQQADAARTGRRTKGLCRSGLWAKSRHPNLFFEVVTWVGFALLGVDEQVSLVSLYGLAGPVFLYLIMRYLTIPITETSMRKSRPNWDELIADTNMFLPFC